MREVIVEINSDSDNIFLLSYRIEVEIRPGEEVW